MRFTPLLSRAAWLIVLSFALPSPAADTVLNTTIDGVDINMWIPDGVKLLRGALVNPADVHVGGEDNVWDEVFRGAGFGHMGMMIQNLNRGNRPTILRKAMEAALKEFAQKSGHAELVHVPLAFGGMSKGGAWSRDIALMMPERAVAYANVVGWVADPEKAGEAGRKVPALFVIGSVDDGFHMLNSIPEQYDPGRKQGALWTLALQWGAAHDWNNANALVVPFLEAMMRARVPQDASPLDGPVKLNELKEADGWLGDRGTWEGNLATIAPWSEYKGDKAAADWLPNRYLAHVWRAFVSKDPPVRIEAATADGHSKLPPPPKRQMVVGRGTEMILAAVSQGTPLKSVQFYDGDSLIGEATAAPWQTAWKKPTPGAHSLFVMWTLADGKQGLSNPGLVVVKQGTGKAE